MKALLPSNTVDKQKNILHIVWDLLLLKKDPMSSKASIMGNNNIYMSNVHSRTGCTADTHYNQQKKRFSPQFYQSLCLVYIYIILWA